VAIPESHERGGETALCYFCGRHLADPGLSLWMRVVQGGQACVHLDDIEQFYSEVAWDYAGDCGWFTVCHECADLCGLLPGFVGHRNGSARAQTPHLNWKRQEN
jgi:hypothetical protein